MPKSKTRRVAPIATPPAPADSARAAGLRYVPDTKPGLTRTARSSGFAYRDAAGKPVRDAETLARIKALAIPPAWTDVWICPTATGHLQATGRDAKRRKQYRYHADFRSARDETKYGRMLAFAHALPGIRKAVARDLKKPGLSRETVLAAVVALLEATLIRVGNDEYARSNRSFGLTTLRDRHVALAGGSIRFKFRGKSGVDHAIDLDDTRLAKIVARCRDLPGQELFQYVDANGAVVDVGSADVNAYLREVSGQDFTAKDYRTWAGTVLASLALGEYEAFDSEAQAKKNVMRAIESVSKKLGNTPTVCRKCYVHPEVIAAYLDGTMRDALARRADSALARLRDLKPEEAAVLALLRRRLAEGTEPAPPPG